MIFSLGVRQCDQEGKEEEKWELYSVPTALIGVHICGVLTTPWVPASGLCRALGNVNTAT